MKTSIGILVSIAFPLTSVLAVTSAMACGNGKLILEDKFETLNPTWGFQANDPIHSHGPDGLVFKLSNNDYGALNEADLYDNYEVCAMYASNVPENSGAWVAISFWGNDFNNKYEFDVYPATGTYQLGRKKNGKWIQPISTTPSDAIERGTNATNEISVTVKDNKATFAANGKKITDFTGSPPDGGSLFGFAVGAYDKDAGPSTFTLKDIQLREVGGATSAGH